MEKKCTQQQESQVCKHAHGLVHSKAIKLTHIEMFFSLRLMLFQTSNFQFLQLGCVGENEKNRCSLCCCYSVPPPRIRQISRSYFLTHKLDISLAYPSGLLLLTISGEVML